MPVCEHCGKEVGQPDCPVCRPPIVSDPDASLDAMVEAASRPTLASLFRKAKATGAIVPTTSYGGKAT